jgi:hypothetical protein
MTNYAKINQNNVVENIIVCSEEEIDTQVGTHVKITSDTNEARIGDNYVSEKNKFKSLKPYDSWILNEETVLWEAPVAKPAGEGFYRWDEVEQNWILVS